MNDALGRERAMKRWIKNNRGKVIIASRCLLTTGVIFSALGFRRAAEMIDETRYAFGIVQALDPAPPLVLFISGIAMMILAFILAYNIEVK